MLMKTVEYMDFDGNPRKEKLYFNLSEAEIVRLDAEFEGGLENHVEKIVEEENPSDILQLFERVLRLSYGEKSEDGRHFMKNQEMQDMFVQSAIYNSLFMSLVTDVDEATAFINALLTRTTVPVPEQE